MYHLRRYQQVGSVCRSLVNPRCLTQDVQPSWRKEQSVPAGASVVIGGGGVIGCSVAYHLAHMGWKDIVLIEQGR